MMSMMSITNVVLLSQSAVYTVSAIVSLCVWIPMSLHLYSFCGHCSLYSTGQYVEEDGSFDPNWSSVFHCVFTLTTAIILFGTAFIQMCRKFILLYRGTDSTFLSAFVDTVLALMATLLVLTDAILVTKGFSVWCQSVAQSCETASSVMVIGKDSDIDPKGFFLELGSVQFGIWSLLVCWVLTLVLASRKLFVYHERENMIVSMARERHRHIGSDYTRLET
ncbi:unnamed protein product [Oppiella nova]|uniref:Uncharacterized protein n=1 Tax=Oppiella nova TaxID=334625 RepID=A0A7R9L8Q6_9ACAR|nr:unnamed protein product [Oppiella nova]CAG2159588.1 unnamed protein product [Oppiella nova]